MLSSYCTDNIQFYQPKFIKQKILNSITNLSSNCLSLSSLGMKELDITFFPSNNQNNSGLDHISQLYLNDNYITFISPNLLGIQFVNLTYMNISGNYLSNSLTNDTFKGLNKLTTLIMDNIINLVLPDNIFEYTPQIVNLRIGSLKDISHNVLYSLKNLKSLTLTFSSYTSEIIISDTLFRYSTEIESISIIKGNLYKLPSTLFSGLNKLNTITIKQTKMNELSKYLFKGLYSLQNVYLTENKLYDIPMNMFEDNPILKLDISFNEFEHLPKEVNRIKSKAEQSNNKCDISISNNPISNENPELLTALKNRKRILPTYFTN